MVVGIGVSGLALLLLLRNVDWDRFVNALWGLEYGWLLLSSAITLVLVPLRMLRWKQLLRPVAKASTRNLFHAVAVGYLMNTVLPGRLGELARVILLARLERVNVLTVLSTAVVDRLMDVVVVAIMLGIVLPMVALPEWMAQFGLVIGTGAVALLASSVLLAYPSARMALVRWLNRLPILPCPSTITNWVLKLSLGADALRGTRQQLAVASMSITIGLLTILAFYFGQLAFGIQSPLAAVLVTAITSLGLVIPSSPGYIGVFHYLVVLGLTVNGVAKEEALGLAVVIHLVNVIVPSVMGVFSLWRLGVGLTRWHQIASGGFTR